MPTFPATTPTTQPAASALLSNNAANKGLTNATPFDRLTNLEQIVGNLLSGLPQQIGFTGFQRTLTALGTVQSTTPTAAQTLGGILTQTSAVGAGTATFPTGAVLSAAFDFVPTAGCSFQCLYMNLGGGFAVTVTAGASGMTVVGTAAIPSAKAALLTFVCTAADTWTVVVTLSA